MDADSRLVVIEAKLDDLQKTIASMRFYSRLTFWVTAVVIIGPLLLLPFVIPLFLSSLSLPADGTAGNAGMSDIMKMLSSLGI